MASSYDKINRREEVNELFEHLGQVLDRKVQILLIGGAVLLEQGLKDLISDDVPPTSLPLHRVLSPL